MADVLECTEEMDGGEMEERGWEGGQTAYIYPVLWLYKAANIVTMCGLAT
jgi:hypothetical protein